MARLLCFPLLFVIAFPLLAQEEPPALGQSLPRDSALLLRMREQLNFQYRETQRTLGFIDPNDTQLVETLRTRQADLAKQMGNIARELQTLGGPNTNEMLPPGMDTRPEGLPTPLGMPGMGIPVMPPDFPATPPMRPEIDRRQSVTPMPSVQTIPQQFEMPPMPNPGVMPPYYPNPYPTVPQQFLPHNSADMSNVPQWGTQAPSWEWGPRLPKELTEVKQSVESLQREIAELRELIRRLETQIQLLNRTILLSSERMGERTSPPGRIVIVQDNEE